MPTRRLRRDQQFDRKGAADALRDVRKQVQRNRERFDESPTRCRCSARWPRASTTTASPPCITRYARRCGARLESGRAAHATETSAPPARARSCPPRGALPADIAGAVRDSTRGRGPRRSSPASASNSPRPRRCRRRVRARGPRTRSADRRREARPTRARKALGMCRRRRRPTRRRDVVKIRDRETARPRARRCPARRSQGRAARYEDTARCCAGSSPERAGASRSLPACRVQARERGPTRMFAGEGDAFRTNRRFHLLADHMPRSGCPPRSIGDAVRLRSDRRPDIYARWATPGVDRDAHDSRAVLGFDCAPKTSGVDAINGPAPTILAMFMNAAVDQQLDKFARTTAASRPRTRRRRSRVDARDGARTVQADILKRTRARTPASTPPSSASR